MKPLRSYTEARGDLQKRELNYLNSFLVIQSFDEKGRSRRGRKKKQIWDSDSRFGQSNQVLAARRQPPTRDEYSAGASWEELGEGC